jgi:glycosyltransferase involved in cell wall biosynthesis
MVSVTAALIARDEEAHIGPCLEKLRTIVDEIVVVDTGSVDSTARIAEAIGARVFHVAWKNDFAYARNAALDRASGDWILYVDADERVVATGDLGDALSNPKAIAARVCFRAASRLSPYHEHRLFRNRADIRFRGIIHETVMPDIKALVGRTGGTIVDAPLSFDHLGYEGDLTAKHKRNLPLLRRAVVDDPERVYLWQVLGEAALGLGDAVAAEDAWRQGLAVLRRRAPWPSDVQIYADLFDFHLSDTGVVLTDIATLIEEANRRHPDAPMILWWSACHYESTGKFAKARECLDRNLAFGPNGPLDDGLGYDLRLFGVFAWSLLGACWLREGEPAKALEWLRRAEAADPSNLEIRTKRGLAEGLIRSRAGPA